MSSERSNYYVDKGYFEVSADDMISADDPWLNFNPADINSFGNFARNIFQW